ncbi:MAG: hypothetical protein ACLPX9_10020, partial [Rhodomicrobium sp.]
PHPYFAGYYLAQLLRVSTSKILQPQRQLKPYRIRLIASAAVIPETPTALSGIVTNAGVL